MPTGRRLGAERVAVFGDLGPRQGQNAEKRGGSLDQRPRLDQRTLQTDGVQTRDKLQVVERRRKAVAQLRRNKFAQPVLGPSQHGGRGLELPPVPQSLRLAQVCLGVCHGRRLERRPLPVPPNNGDNEGRCQQHAGCQRPGQSRPASHPAHGAFNRPHGTGLDGLASLETAQVLRQSLRAGIALVRLFVQALQADGFQVARHARVEPRGRHRLVGHHLLQRRRRASRRGTAAGP